MNRANILFAELGARIGLEGLSLDDNKQIFLDLEGDLAMSIQWREETETLLFHAMLTKSAIEEVELLKTALQSNYVFADEHGMSFCMAPETNQLCLTQVVSLADNDSFKLEAKLDKFIRAAGAWYQRLQSSEPISPDWQHPAENTGANPLSSFEYLGTPL